MIALLGFLGALAAFVGILSALSTLVLIINAVAGLSMWSGMAMLALGFKPDPLTFFGGGAVLAVILIVCGNMWPERTNRFFEVFGTLFSIAAMSAMFLFIGLSLVAGIGMPGWLLLNYLSGAEQSPLWLPFIGAATIAAYQFCKRQIKATA